MTTERKNPTYLKKIFIHLESKNDPLTRDILKKIPKITPLFVNDNQEVVDYFKSFKNTPHHPIDIGKQTLYISRYKGEPLKKCPGTPNQICCNYFIFSPITNCPFDCSYCFMQAYMTNYAICIYSNIDDILTAITNQIKANPDYFYRIGTGELGDSLALDHLVPLSTKLIKIFAPLKNASLELKTKSSRIDALKNITNHQNTIIAWSLNPEKIRQREEKYTASIEKRLSAAYECQELGYNLAFHFDPLLYYPNYEEDYRDLISNLFAHICPEKISWISLGTFRYLPPLKKIIKARFPESKILLEEFVLCDDGKMRYDKFTRARVFETIVSLIKKYSPSIPLYFCMESKEMWKKVMGSTPGKTLDHLFKRPQ